MYLNNVDIIFLIFVMVMLSLIPMIVYRDTFQNKRLCFKESVNIEVGEILDFENDNRGSFKIKIIGVTDKGVKYRHIE